MEEKRVQEMAIRTRDATIAKKTAEIQNRDAETTRLHGILMDSARTSQETLDMIGVPRVEEQKEEPEYQLIRLTYLAKILAQDGFLTYEQPTDEQATPTEKPEAHFFTYDRMDKGLEFSVIKFDQRDGTQIVETPELSMNNWVSCQID